MIQQLELLTKENIVTIREIQKNPSRALKGITRVIRNGKTLGFFISQIDLGDLFDDIEGAFTPIFQKQIATGKKQIATGKVTSLEAVKSRYGL